MTYSPSNLTPQSTQDEVIDQWIADLRSGEFLQGDGQLHTRYTEGKDRVQVDKMCCLGVLSFRAAQAGVCAMKQEGTDGGVMGPNSPTGPDVAYIDAVGGSEINYLLPDVSAWSGISRTGRFTDDLAEGVQIWGQDTNVTTLAGMNDAGASFEAIADAIEARREALKSFADVQEIPSGEYLA